MMARVLGACLAEQCGASGGRAWTASSGVAPHVPLPSQGSARMGTLQQGYVLGAGEPKGRFAKISTNHSLLT